GPGMWHMGPWTRMPSGPAAGLRTAGVGRFAASPGMSARMPLPGVTFSPQFAARPFGTAQGLFNTPETAQFQASMRQFEAEAARIRAARQPSLAATSWWGRNWW